MTCAPFVMGKSGSAFGRAQALEDTTTGWRFVNLALDALYGTEAMPRTAENVAQDFGISRADKDAFALRSQQRTITAQQNGFHAVGIVPVIVPSQKKGETIEGSVDEHPRADTTTAALQKFKPPVRAGRDRHHRQRIRHQRWRSRDDRGERGGG